MTHYHVGFNLAGQSPEGEAATYASLDDAIAAVHVNVVDIAAGFDEPTTVTVDDDPDVTPGTSAWVTVNPGEANEFAYYVWAGQAEDAAGIACDCHAACPPDAHDRSLPDVGSDPQNVAEDGLLACNDCGRPAYYCTTDDSYHHVDPHAFCFLIPS